MMFLFNAIIFLGLALFAYLSWRKIELGIYAIIFCLPLYLVRVDVFGVPSTALELGIYILFIIWFVKNYRSVKFSKIVPDKMLSAGIVLLLAGAAISTVFSANLEVSAGILKGWFLDPVLVFIILAASVRTCEQKVNILKWFFLSATVVSLLCLMYLISPGLNGLSYDGRLYGFYLSPNYLAMYLSPALVVGIWLVYRKFSVYSWKDNRSNIMFLLGIFDIILICLAIYFTYSYSAWVAIAVSLFFWIILAVPPVKRKIFFGAISLVLAVLILNQNGTSKFENLKNLAARSSYSSRLMIWRSALEIGKDNPIIGIGPGNFQEYYLDYQPRFPEPYLEWAVPHPHNIFLAFWVETGILGVWGFVVLLIWFFRHSLDLLKSGQTDRDNFLLAAVLFSVMVYTIIHGLFDTTYWKNDLAIIFWLSLALLATIKKQPITG